MHRNIDTDLLRTFLVVSETGKFSIAADRIGRTQAAVSLQIKRLEDLLGQVLFERNSRNVRLSTAGEVLHEYAQQIINMNDEAFFRLSEADISGVLRLGAPEALTSTHLPKILALFNKQHPSVALDVTCKLTDDLLNDYDRGSYDVVIFKREKRNKKSGTIIYKEPLVWAKSKKYQLDFSKTLPLILSPHPCIYRRLAIESLEKKKQDWRATMTAHSLYGRISAVKNGIGISLISKDLIDKDLDIIDNQTKLPSNIELEMAVMSHENKNKALASSFIEHLVHYFEAV